MAVKLGRVWSQFKTSLTAELTRRTALWTIGFIVLIGSNIVSFITGLAQLYRDIPIVVEAQGQDILILKDGYGKVEEQLDELYLYIGERIDETNSSLRSTNENVNILRAELKGAKVIAP